MPSRNVFLIPSAVAGFQALAIAAMGEQAPHSWPQRNVEAKISQVLHCVWQGSGKVRLCSAFGSDIDGAVELSSPGNVNTVEVRIFTNAAMKKKHRQQVSSCRRNRPRGDGNQI